MNALPIGIFDSGVGGLTVAKEIISQLPHENILYVGDTARVPYGSRSKTTIIKYSLELVRFLLKHKVKLLVIACNTISATALEEIKRISPVPVVEVITPTVSYALSLSKTNHIGVIGTEATIRSNIYNKVFHNYEIQSHVSSVASPLLVPLIEEGLFTNKGTGKIVQHYMDKLTDKEIDTLVLGCTHYPLLTLIIKKYISSTIQIIDSASPTALEVKKLLNENKILNTNKSTGERLFYVTDDPQKAEHIAKLFFGKELQTNVKKITL